MTTVQDVRLDDGRTVRVHDTGDTIASATLTLVWHHGSPQTGAPLAPLVAAAAERGIRLVSYGRPSYGGSTPKPGRDVASAASDVAQLADALGVDRFAAMGASGGGPHALACGALLPDRVIAVACLATLAPFGAEGLDWYAGMAGGGASLRAAEQGRAARVLFEESSEFDPTSFIDRDYAALDGTWSSLGDDVGVASAAGADGLIDDDLAYVGPWGFEVSTITQPVLLAHGGLDRVVPPAHSEWLLRHCPDAELWLRPHDGHVSILDVAPVAMEWLRARAQR
ncbi:MAG TPA: alpha/beta hydrolase [Lacisediminihabitans sp.]|nr:alpha/beta hydrolase [Lacisediminihabitans sp.]HXD61687.1 alpha/beta hydrolase [Lacisediminihabitans sp.]